MSSFGKEPDPSKGGAGGAQKDCDACGNRDHVVKQASKEGNWDKTKQNASDLSAAAQASADRAGDKHGGVLGQVLGGRISDWGEFRMDYSQGGFRMAEIAEVAEIAETGITGTY